MTYEAERAMFEGYGRNKYTSTGVIQWMLNNAWPSLIWHLYDWYMRPGGGYFGTKEACEPLHVQYSLRRPLGRAGQRHAGGLQRRHRNGERARPVHAAEVHEDRDGRRRT